jgi:hypothetical protein
LNHRVATPPENSTLSIVDPTAESGTIPLGQSNFPGQTNPVGQPVAGPDDPASVSEQHASTPTQREAEYLARSESVFEGPSMPYPVLNPPAQPAGRSGEPDGSAQFPAMPPGRDAPAYGMPGQDAQEANGARPSDIALDENPITHVPEQADPPNPAAPKRESLPIGENLQQVGDAAIIARIGNEIVLAAEVMPAINEFLEERKSQIPSGQLEEVRRRLVQQRLQGLIETKVLYADFLRTVPSENHEVVREKIGEQFEESELPRLMKQAKVNTRAELDALLRKSGGSISAQKEAFLQRMVAMQWLREHVREEGSTTRHEMLTYYREHQPDYFRPGRARWEELVVTYDPYDRANAWRKIAQAGNQILDGTPLNSLAPTVSSGVTSQQGGQRDWVTKGGLRAKQVDHAIFTLPVGHLSPIIDDDGAFYIVRVLEREEDSVVSFLEAQVEIRDKIRLERRREQTKEFIAKLKKDVPVWTTFDDDPAAKEFSEELFQSALK